MDSFGFFVLTVKEYHVPKRRQNFPTYLYSPIDGNKYLLLYPVRRLELIKAHAAILNPQSFCR